MPAAEPRGNNVNGTVASRGLPQTGLLFDMTRHAVDVDQGTYMPPATNHSQFKRSRALQMTEAGAARATRDGDEVHKS